MALKAAVVPAVGHIVVAAPWPWPAMFVHTTDSSSVLWLLMWLLATLGVLHALSKHVRGTSDQYYRCLVSLTSENSHLNAVTVSEVPSQALRGNRIAKQTANMNGNSSAASTATTTLTTNTASPIVRSVDIQPVAPALAMRVRVVQLSSSVAKQTTPAMATTTAAVATTAMPMDAETPVVLQDLPCESMQQHKQPYCDPPAASTATLSASSSPSSSSSSSSSMRIRWKLSGWMLMSLTLFAICGHATVARAEAATGYIVLVSIPILDKVLPLKNLAQELLHRGYRVGFALPENYRHWINDLDHLEFISLGNTISGKSQHDFLLQGTPLQQQQEHLHSIGDVYSNYAATLRYYASFQRSMYSALVDDFEDDRPDLVIVDRYTFAGFDACHTSHIPYIVNSASLLLDMDAPPAYIAAPFSNFTMRAPSVLERCLNSVYRLRFRLAMVGVFQEINHVRKDNGLPTIHGKEDLMGYQLVLVNSVFGLDEARPIAPQFQMIGMLEKPSVASNKPQFSPDLARWLAHSEKALRPVVLISFDTQVPLSPEFVAVILNALEKIDARLIWKITLREQAAFDLRTRAPQSVFFLGDTTDASKASTASKKEDDDPNVVGHLLRSVSLLITGGDHFSVQQAFAHGVPVLGIPTTAEQWETMNLVVRTGSGLQLQGPSFTEPHVHGAVSALLNNPQYAEAASYLGDLLKTGGGTQRAADQVESVLEFGVAHAIPLRNIQPLFKTYLVDVYLVYSVILFCSVIILRTCFAIVSSILQIAPEVHLGMALDDDLPEGDPEGEMHSGHHHQQHHQHQQHQHHDVPAHKQQQMYNPSSNSHGHHHHHHGKVKDL